MSFCLKNTNTEWQRQAKRVVFREFRGFREKNKYP